MTIGATSINDTPKGILLDNAPLKLNLESLTYTKRSSKFKEQEKTTKLTNLIT